jgi:hypothetical protein
MGIVNGTNISHVLKLMQGSWNARPYGPLHDLQVMGVSKATDFYFKKSKVSLSSLAVASLLFEEEAWCVIC